MIIPWLIMIAICLILMKSFLDFFRGKSFAVAFEMKESRFSTEIFMALLVLYIIIMLGYGMIYFILSIEGIVLVENGELRQVSILGSIIHSVYFSGVTLLSVGYGDITPVGVGRFIALTQALIGYILPAAFVVKIFQTRDRSRDT